MLSNWQCIVAQLLAEGDFASPDFLISLGKRGVTISLSVVSLRRLTKVKPRL
jgi:hypothetical protein